MVSTQEKIASASVQTPEVHAHPAGGEDGIATVFGLVGALGMAAFSIAVCVLTTASPEIVVALVGGGYGVFIVALVAMLAAGAQQR